MFSLEKTVVKLANVNLRSELHGEDHRPAADLKIEASLANDVLSELSPTLKSLLYVKDEEQADLVSSNDPGYLMRRRFPLMAPFKWGESVVGAEIIVHHGLGGKSDLTLSGCTVDGFQIDPQEGGTVNLSFRIQAHPDEKQIGKLSTLIQTDIELSVIPPENTEGA